MSAPVRFNYKKGDRLPLLDVILENTDESEVNLTGCTVKFIMKLLGGTTAKVDAAATVMSAADGEVRYSWGATDLDTVGIYRGEFEVTDSGGLKRTFPSTGYVAIVVSDDLG